MNISPTSTDLPVALIVEATASSVQASVRTANLAEATHLPDAASSIGLGLGLDVSA